ncbi:MAG: TlpA family protein disulfide reductase [Burkholderiaceae bacterium]|jgi:thiol-disulfide isomerase/thioredoxin|nr:TlpA family protein disulfide reductase [Burkholderiaceae bacterium]
MSKLGTAGIAVTVAAIAGLAGFLAFRGSAPSAPASTLTPIVTPDAASAADATALPTPATAAAAIPEVLPDFELASREGPPRTLASFQHPVLIVNFWATWCAPCRREIPLLNALRREHADAGVEIVGIAVDFREDVLAYAQTTPIDYPLLIGEEDGLAAAQAFGMNLVLPFTIFADAQRRIVALKVGELHADEAEFILARIAALNAGRETLEQVRPAIAAELATLAANRATRASATPAASAPPVASEG